MEKIFDFPTFFRILNLKFFSGKFKFKIVFYRILRLSNPLFFWRRRRVWNPLRVNGSRFSLHFYMLGTGLRWDWASLLAIYPLMGVAFKDLFQVILSVLRFSTRWENSPACLPRQFFRRADLVMISREITTLGCNPVLGFIIDFDFKVLECRFLKLRSELHGCLCETLCSSVHCNNGTFL